MTTNLSDNDSRIPVGLKHPQEQARSAIGRFVPFGSGTQLVPRADRTGADCPGIST